MNLFRTPIDLYNHRKRYITLFVFHTVDAVCFLIRFILICVDLSAAQQIPPNIAYPVCIFLLEMFGSLPVLVGNMIYFITYCFRAELFQDDTHPVCCRRRTALRIATLTCLPCQCYLEHPQGIQLTRISILMGCYVLRFIAFILGASCATTFAPRCVGYAVMSSLALIPSTLTLIVEWFHFHCLWNYQPNVGNTLGKSRDRSHLRFIPEKITNQERLLNYDQSLCEYATNCRSNSIHHILLYHSLRPNPMEPVIRLEDKPNIIAFHVTTIEKAIEIAQSGFPVTVHRTVLPEITFTRTVATRTPAEMLNPFAIICVRLSLGHVHHIDRVTDFNFPAHENLQPKPQTLHYLPIGLIKVRFPGQIENWIITLHTTQLETFDASFYDGCI